MYTILLLAGLSVPLQASDHPGGRNGVAAMVAARPPLPSWLELYFDDQNDFDAHMTDQDKAACFLIGLRARPVPYQEFLYYFKRIAYRLPPGAHAEQLRRDVGLLERMAVEDEERRIHPPRTGPGIPTREVVADLIFQLRDQWTCRSGQPDGHCIINLDPKRGDPADRLLRMGDAAVPQLIEALDDVRFTYCDFGHASDGAAYHVMRVGDWALLILERMAGRQFWIRSPVDIMVEQGKAPEVKKAVKTWWTEHLKAKSS